MLPRLRESLALVLITLLPFHALLVTVATKLIAGAGHAPLGILAVWKEVMLGVILLLAIIEFAQSFHRNATPACPVSRSRLRGETVESIVKLDAIDICILFGIFYAFILELLKNYSFFIIHSSFLLGFKYDFLPLLAFLILRRVSWSAWFQNTVINVLLSVGAIVALYGIATFFVPMNFFVLLGYSDLHSLYQAEGPLAAFQQIGGSTLRRIQSTMSGPNQLGVWMVIPLGLLIASTTAKKAGRKKFIALLLAYSLCLIALLLTFSRAAWIGAGVMVALMLWQKQKRLLVYLFACLIAMSILGIALAPQILIRKQSLLGHIEKPLIAIQTIIAHPFGLGLGSAGPASNRTSDTCIEQAVGSDISWAKDRPDLCLFVGGTQVLPTHHTCSCPLLTENWYLQWGVEMGWVGLVLSLALPFLILRKLFMNNEKIKVNNFSLFTPLFSFTAIAIAGLFLHAWEDSAVALTVWVILAMTRLQD